MNYNLKSVPIIEIITDLNNFLFNFLNESFVAVSVLILDINDFTRTVE